MTERVYRTLLLLYPKSFRLAYGEDMVAVFEEMRRDRSALSLWWRVTVDAAASIPVQRMESLMSQVSSRTITAGFFGLLAVFVALALRGTPGTAFGFLFVLLAAVGLMLVLFLRSRAAYVEPAMQMHRHWWRYFAAAFACFGGALVGANALKLDAWMLLVLDVVAGWCLVVMGVVLGAWHGVYRVRALRSS